MLHTPRLAAARHCEPRARRSASVLATPRDEASDPVDDAYTLLDLPPSASKAELRTRYVALQRKFHPDVAGPDGAAKSVQLNLAYELLTSSPSSSRSTLRARRGSSGPPPRTSGLVGPLQSTSLLERRGRVTEDAPLNEARDSMREWLSTLNFTTEAPFPVPLLVDVTSSGARVAFASSALNAQGGIELEGELDFAFDSLFDEVTEEELWQVTVLRRSPLGRPDTPLAGEKRLLKAFERELELALQLTPPSGRRSAGGQLPGWLSWLAPILLVTSSIASVPSLLGDDGGQGYSGYRLKRSCRLADKPAEEAMREGEDGAETKLN